LAIQKIIKKNPQKSLFSMFEPFWEALCPDFIDLVVQKGVLGGEFSTFCFIVFLTWILDHVLKKKMKKWISIRKKILL